MIQWLNGHNWGYIPHLLSTGLIIILSHKHSGGIPWVYHGILHFQTQVFFIFSDPTSHDSRLLLERSFDQSISALESMTWVWHGLTVRYSQIRWVSYGFVIVFPIHIANFWGSSPHFFRWLEPGRRSRTAFCSTSKLRTMVCPNTERRSDGSRNMGYIMIYYPLVNIYITIKHHNFQWVNQL